MRSVLRTEFIPIYRLAMKINFSLETRNIYWSGYVRPQMESLVSCCNGQRKELLLEIDKTTPATVNEDELTFRIRADDSVGQSELDTLSRRKDAWLPRLCCFADW